MDDGLDAAEVVEDGVAGLAGLEVGAVGLEAAAHPAVLNEGEICRMSKNSWSNLKSNLYSEMGQDFLDRQYVQEVVTHFIQYVHKVLTHFI